MNDMVEVDLQDFLRVLIKKAWLVGLCAVVAASVSLIYTMNFVAPQYTASICMYVNNSSNRDSDYISSGDLSAASQLVATYAKIVESDAVLEKVAADAGLVLSASQIRDMIETSTVSKTGMFEVTVTSTNPQMSADIANTIAKIAPEQITAIIEGSSAKIIDYAKKPARPSGPDYAKYASVSFFCGLLLALVAVAVVHLADNRIKGELELQSICKIPVLGRIPNLDMETKKPSKDIKR